MNNDEIIEWLLGDSDYRHPKPQRCSYELYKIMNSCWRYKPETRPTFDHLFYTMDDFSVAAQDPYMAIDSLRFRMARSSSN